MLPYAPFGKLCRMSIRVVLADDSDEVRTMLRMALEIDGRFEVVGEAADGEQAVGAVKDLRPDAIFLDLMMPEVSGLEAIPRIRAECPDTKIVVLSVAAMHPSSADARRLGAAAVIQKGGDQTADELAAEVAGLFA